ncbi:MAG: DUF4105 domain-containing protein [Paludibacteraceae bacterium]|nr:DUF4105 domain-containing protein [Paludibacteraceae bacterium]
MKKLLVAILLVFTSFSAAFADAVDPLFGDTIDRNAEDFVLVSLCVADPTDWRDDVLGVSGHAFLRLQCPTFNLDFCFSYEGENVNDNMFRYLSGDTKMGMFAVPTDEYLQDYNRWNRSVHEYRLNLPPQVEQRLWEIMDNHLTGKILLRQDLNKYGCAITVVKYVKKALNGMPIVYAPDPELERMTRREIGYRSLEAHPWMRLFSMLLTDNRYNDNCPLDEKLIVPSDLAEVWQKATLDDKPFAVYLGDLVEGAELTNNKTWLTPMLVALIILLLTICFALTRYQFWDWTLLALQTFGGILLIAFLIVSVVSGSSIYILLVLLNPLPAMLWYWRKYWGIVYSAVLLLGTIVLACQPHMLIDPAMLVLALAYVILYAKPFVKAMIEKRK